MKDDKMDNVTLRIDCVDGDVVVYRDRAQVEPVGRLIASIERRLP